MFRNYQTTIKLCSAFSMLALFTACGNPHLTTSDLESGLIGLETRSPEADTTMEGELLRVVNAKELNSSQVNFGKSLKGERPLKEQIVLQNISKTDLDLAYSFEVGKYFRFNGGSFPGSNGNCKEQMVANKTCSLDIEFDAEEVGRYEDTLLVTDKNSKKVLAKIPLLAEILDKDKNDNDSKEPNDGSVKDDNQKVKIDGALVQLDYSQVEVGTEKSKMLKLSNDKSDVTITRIQILGDRDFSLGEMTTCKVGTVMGSCLVDAEFKPQGLGEKKAMVEITYQDGTKTLIPLNGIGTKKEEAPKDTPKPGPGKIEVVLDGKQLDFKKVEIDSTQSRVVEFINRDTNDVVIQSMIINGSQSFKMGSATTCKIKFKPGNCFVDIEYSPATLGSENAVLDIELSNGQKLAVPLKGEGIAKKVSDCDEFNQNLAPALSKKDAANLSPLLPYSLSHAKTKSKLKKLYGIETNAKTKDAKTFIVSDAQVVTSFKVPKFDGKLTDIVASVDLLKIQTKTFNDTEMICLSSQHVNKCSGRLFNLKEWIMLTNKSFFSKVKGPVNDQYEIDLAGHVINCGTYNCEIMDRDISLRHLLQLTDAELEILSKDQNIHLILTDDTRNMTMPLLNFVTKETKACK